MTTPANRAELAAAGRLVVKVGSSSLTDPAGHLLPDRLAGLVAVLAGRLGSGRQVVLVSSGAQAAGMGPLGLTSRPRTLAQAQAAASVGQGLLMAHYCAAFAEHGFRVGQVLLTSRDLVHRSTYANAERAMMTLLENNIVPVVNENDVVATDEIRFGDNDRLAALVAHLVRADGLILLSDVDGLYTAPPSQSGSQRLSEIANAEDLADLMISGRGSTLGTGGMITKVQAATLATSSGIPVLLTAADKVAEALNPGLPDHIAAEYGTFFQVTGQRVSAKRLWLGYAATAKGRLTVDAGAAKAVTSGKKSLLAVGVSAVEGDFGPGDVVEITDTTGRIIARGRSGFAASELAQVKGLSQSQIADQLGPDRAIEAVHRDELTPQARARRPDVT